MPLVSVVMPTYNSKYVWQAVDSILNQDLSDFEFIIVDGSPVNGLLKILEEHGVLDKRIIIEYRPDLLYTAALNHGCKLAKGKYIARMDSDDISYRNRFSKQVAFLEAHPDIGLVGSWRHDYDESGMVITATKRPPTNPYIIKWALNFGDCVTHSSIMARADVLERIGFYDQNFAHSEDYDLLARASAVTKIANIPEILMAYRRHSGQATVKSPEYLEDMSAAKVMQRMIQNTLGYDVPLELVFDARRVLAGRALKMSADGIRCVSKLLEDTREAYLKKNHLIRYEEREIKKDANRMLFWIGIQAARKHHSPSILVKAMLRDPALPIFALAKKLVG